MAQKYRTLQVGVLDEGVLGVAIDGRRRFGEARPVQAHSLRCCAIPGRAVRKIDYAGSGIVAICARGKYRQAIPVLDLLLPDPPPQGTEWISAYRRRAG